MTNDLFGKVPEKNDEQLLKQKFADYWLKFDAWDGDRLYRTVIGCASALMEMAEAPDGPQPNRVGAMRAAGELFARLLNKQMPDLKAIELSGNAGMTHEDALEQLALGIGIAEKAVGQLPAVRADMPPNTNEGGVH